MTIDEKLDLIIELLKLQKHGPRTSAHWTELPAEWIADLDHYITSCMHDATGTVSCYQTAKQVADGAGIPPSNRMTRCVKSYLADNKKLRVENGGFKLW